MGASDELSGGSCLIAVPGETEPLDCHVVRHPHDASAPWVIVCMELFGVNDHIRDVCSRLAAQGYHVIAPNFYHRTLPGASLPFGEAGRGEGFRHLNQLTRAQALADAEAVVNWIHEQPLACVRIGVLGFSVGGHIAFLAAACLDIAACACFYAGWLLGSEIALSQPEPTITLAPRMAERRAALVYFVGGRDHVISPRDTDQLGRALEAAHVRHELIVFAQAQHGFFCELRETFDEGARDASWKQVLELFGVELRG